MNLYHRLIVMTVLMTMALFAAGPSWGCDAMGPNRHVGRVTAIDHQVGTFTIIDAQIKKPLSFTADKEILEALKLDRTFVITYRMEGEQMKAEAVQSPS